ncbi:MAG: type II CRISPR RNA-guided endonuclease Cas9 [Synergistaceae bacterium]|nr:type II CRISPR RNA-guided endonuclease Cas9 [Synergistaceae bacterium]
MMTSSSRRMVLGLDLGSNSLGWALLEFDQEEPKAIIDCGVRIFQAGLEGEMESGKAVSRARERREKRSARRQVDRRKRRREHLLHLLQAIGLLPPGSPSEIFPSLDKELIAKYADGAALSKQALASNLPYRLRAWALDKPLDPFELGRVLYHLGQRRGFLSNRKTPAKEEEGVVASAISELRGEMAEAGARTLGEYLAGLNPHERRIRGRYTHRSMYQEEFDAICSAQSPSHRALNDETIGRIKKAIFFQRPLKSAKGLVGRCELEPNSKRASWATLEAQRFRYLQVVNNCLVKEEGDISFRPFSGPERDLLIGYLEREGDLTFAQAKKLLGFKSRKAVFSLEAGEEKRFPGNRINKRMREVFGEEWMDFDRGKKEAILADLRGYRDGAALAERVKRAWGLSEPAAQTFAAIELEPGYCALSRKAITKLLPYLEKGVSFASARKEVYGEHLKLKAAADLLPPVNSCFAIRNPAVERSLTELRKVVNGVLRKYGKPDLVKIELAREMKQSQKVRKRITSQNREREAMRKKGAEKIVKEVGIGRPSRNDILKVMLADECGWICPYTSRPISMTSLFGAEPQFDIEHIIPFSRSFDDSFANKTLCHVDENRNVKRNKSPWEAYGESSRWEQIIGNVSRFQGEYRDAKLERFTKRPEELEDLDGFIARQMNDTRYASKLAMNYMGTLYGGLSDGDGRQRVFAVTGQVTALLRNVWNMNSVLSDGGIKERGDHRHHAVDAVAIALTNPATIQSLSRAALASCERNAWKKRFRDMALPWPTFSGDLKEKIGAIRVSHRTEHKVNAALHEDSHYGILRGRKEKGFCIRRKLSALKASEVDQIVDGRIAGIIRDRLLSLGKKEPSKAFVEGNPEEYPFFISKKGEKIWIRKVRIRVALKAQKIGQGRRERFVAPRSNHHAEIAEVADKKGQGKTRWQCRVVSTLEAMDRIRKGLPVVSRDGGEGRFLFSVAPGDTLKLGNPGAWPEYIVVRTVSQGSGGAVEIAGVSLSDARMKKDIIEAKGYCRIRSMSHLECLRPQKVVVLPWGDVVLAGD